MKLLHFPPNIKLNPFLKYVWIKTKGRNSNFILLVVGLPGSGKSYAALNLLYNLMVQLNGKSKLTPENCMDRVVFSAIDFSKAVERFNAVGDVLIWEEAATIEGANSRRFWEEKAIYISSLFQTMRFKNQVIILTLPSGLFLDKQLRMICHGTIIMQGHDEKRSWGKIRIHSYSPEQNKTYMPSPRFVDENENIVKVGKVFFDLPPKWLIEKYEEKQQAWKRLLQAKTIAFIEKVESEQMTDKQGVYYTALGVAERNWRDYWNEDKKKFEVSALLLDEDLKELNLGMKMAYSVCSALKFRKDKDLLV
jgi:hypothetical protein